MKLLLKNGRLVSPGVDIACGYLTVENRRIETIGSGACPATGFDEVIDCAGLIVAPGFIDIHCHGRSGADFCDGSKESFECIGRTMLEDGVTAFLATSLSVSTADLRRMFHAAAAYAQNMDNGATLLGIHLEGPFINPACCGAQNPRFLLPPDIELVKELSAIFPILKVSFSPELPRGIEFARDLQQHRIMPSGAHSNADYECFRKACAVGMKHLTHFCNAMTPIHHLKFGMTAGGLITDSVLVGIIGDGVHLCDEMIKLIAVTKGPERIMLITDAMRAAAMPDGDYDLGGLAVKVNHGRATIADGQVAGSVLRYHNGFKRLLEVTGWSLQEAIKTTSWNQAQSLGITGRGKLAAGFYADLTVLDGALEPQITIVEGEIRWRNASGN